MARHARHRAILLIATLAALLLPAAAHGAARSVDVHFVNDTAHRVYRTDLHLDHGVWKTVPHDYVDAYGSADWRSESSGFMTGTEGWVKYDMPGFGTAWLKWNNPYYGSNSYDSSAPAGFRVSRSGGDGDNASVTFTLKPALTASCRPSSGVFTVSETTALGFTLGYANDSAVAAAFSATMNENPVFGPAHVFDSAYVEPGLGEAHNLTVALWLRQPGPGTYHIVIRITSPLTGPDVLAACDFTLVLTPRAPANTALPAITGEPRVGTPLTCTPGTWDRVVTSTRFRWRDDAGAERGTAATYVPTPADEGHTLACEVTATNSGGSTTARSRPTAVVVPRPPVNTGAPAISGAAKEAATLTCARGTWDGRVDSYSYEWRYEGSDSASALGMGETYTPATADVGRRLVCRVIAANAGGSATAASAPSDPVLPRSPASVEAPAITGTPDIGRALTCAAGRWLPDPAAVATRYRFVWTREPNPAHGQGSRAVLKDHTEGSAVAPVSVYVAVPDDFDHVLRCEVTAINDGGQAAVDATVRIRSAGEGPRTLELRGLTIVVPRRLALGAGRTVPAEAVAAKAGSVTLVLRSRDGHTVARQTRRIRRAGPVALQLSIPKRAEQGRYRLTASMLARDHRRPAARTVALTLVR